MAVYIWKYSGDNYFDTDTSYLDKIQINWLPQDSFPIFNFVTEKISGIAQYKTGDFDLKLTINGDETSASGDTINDFFRGGTRDYKYVIGIGIGTKQYWGFTTNEFIIFNYSTRTLEITCARAETEASQAFNKGFIKLLGSDQSFDTYLSNFPHLFQSNITRLTITTAFSSYANLIAEPNVIANAEIHNNGGWVGTVNTWDGFLGLMVGTGLNWKFVYANDTINFTENYPLFNIQVFSMQNLTACTSILQIIEAEDLNIFRKLEWLYFKNAEFDITQMSNFTGNDLTIEDGTVSNGSITYHADSFWARFTNILPLPIPSYWYPGFTTDNLTPGTKYIISPPTITKTNYLGIDTQTVDLPLYRWGEVAYPTYAGQSVSFSRVLTTSHGIDIFGIPSVNAHRAVQTFAMLQYARYIGGLSKRALRLKIIYNGSEDFDLWKTLSVITDGIARTYYISEINNINLTKREAELLLIQT